jgi:WD40 repeat protein
VQFQDKWKFGAYTSSMLTHDARRFVHIDNGGVVRIADLDSGTRREVGHLRDVAYTLDTSADGRLVAAGGRDGTARIIDLETGAERAHFECHGIVWNLSFSRDATKVAAACGDGQVRILELATGHVRELAGHSGAVAGVDFTRDGTGAISCGVDGTVRLWNLASGLGVLVHRAPGPITGARFVGDSSLILDRSHDARMLRLWDSKALPALVPAPATLMPWLAVTTTAEVDQRGVLASPP